MHALCGVDFAAQTGTILGLLGPNGAGKTTAVRILATLLQPDGGTARVAGLDVVKDADALRTKIGLAGQYAAVDENLTGFENLEMVGQLYHLPRAEARKRADELLERFDLTDAAGRPAKTYSGGMRRRLDLAAALVYRPPVIFLDEPTTGLDPRAGFACGRRSRPASPQGTTVLLTTQYLEEADRLADQIVGDRPRQRDRRGHLGRAQGPRRRRAARRRRSRTTPTPSAAIAALAEIAADRPTLRRGRRARPGARALGRDRRGRARASTPPASGSTTSRCAARRSTTSSSRSPATPPRSTPPRGEEVAA